MGKKNFFELTGVETHIEEADLKVFEHSGEVIADIAEQGCVLLKNDGTLPLKTRRVNVFGALAATPNFGGGGSGSGSNETSVGFFQALDKAGIEYNISLYNLYKNWTAAGKAAYDPVAKEGNNISEGKAGMAEAIKGMMQSVVTKELPASDISQETWQQAKQYSETAIYVMGRHGSEQHDNTIPELRLSEAEKATIDKLCETFKDVIIILNTASVMELGFIDSYAGIKAALFIGFPGSNGMDGVARLLTGEANPSGRTNDIFFYNIEDIPAIKNSGTFVYKGTEHRPGLTGKRNFLLYKEGIYIGYRYAETFLDEEQYKKTIQYPFGYGLSYTTFEWSDMKVDLVKAPYSPDADEIVDVDYSVTVKVTNTGDVSGKDVVELYLSAPYTGRTERAKRTLLNFAKTKELAPGESEIVTIKVDRRFLAAYSVKDEGYIIEEGIHKLQLCRNSHEVVLEENLKLEPIVYHADTHTGRPVRNRLGHIRGSFTLFTRKDPEGTFPKAPENWEYIPTQKILDFENKEAPIIGGADPITGADNGLMWKDLKGRTYDDEIWQKFVEQLTYEELRDIIVYGGWQTLDVPRLGVPEGRHLDGPAGFMAKNDRNIATAYPSETLLACSWNTELARTMGESVGDEARVYGIHFWYGPAMNIHRTPIGGRCFEYYSEDPTLAGKMAAATVKGAQSKNLIPMCKHFAINEEDKHRMTLHTWCDEQAAREIYLKPFEMAVKDGKTMGIMSAINDVGEKWIAEDPAFMIEILREEWGFEGCAITDSDLTKTQRPDTGIPGGSDLWLTMIVYRKYLKMLDKQYKRDPNGLVRSMQRAVKNVLWAHAHTDLME